jgi:hypothetical protein
MGFYVAHSGADAVPTVFNGTNQFTHDFGIATAIWNRNAVGNNDNITCGYNQTADDVTDGLWLVEEEYIPQIRMAPLCMAA